MPNKSGRVDARVLELAASMVQPPERMRTSDWAAKYVRLGSKEAQDAGRYNPDAFPWLRDVLDVAEDNPSKIGMMSYKPSQLGFTIAAFIKLMHRSILYGGKALYMIGTKDKAGDLSDLRFRDIALNTEPFRRILTPKMLEVINWSTTKFDRGEINWTGAGSPGDLITTPYRLVIGDEFHLILHNTKKFTGDPVNQLIARMKRQRQTWIELFGHPTFEDTPFDLHYKALTDQRAWVFDCPHGGCTVRLTGIDTIDIPTGPNGKLDPSRAVLACPGCGKEITDAQRALAVWKPTQRPTGTGRFEIQIDAEEARSKPFVGVEVHGICDPKKSVREIAARWVAAPDDLSRQSLLNYELGQKFVHVKKRVSMASVAQCVSREPIVLVPGLTCKGGVRFVTAGVDVQWPKENPWLYFVAVGWASSGVAFVHRRKLRGWAALHEAARSYGMPWRHPDGSKGGELGIRSMGIDAQGQMSGIVKDECRIGCRECYCAHGGHLVRWVPLQYNSKMTSDEIPWLKVEKESRIVDPVRPELGELEMYELRRHCWVDRTYGRVVDAGWVFLDGVDEELKAHMASNVLQPVKSRHAMEAEREEWMLPRGLHDDWARALDYATAVAVIRHKLDLIHQLDAPEELRSRQRQSYAERRHSGDDWLPDARDHWGGL